jgi:hypothetical protein
MALNKRHGEHGRHEGQDAGGAIEKEQRPIQIEFPHQRSEGTLLLGRAHELVEIGEGVEDDVQPGQADEADHERLQELPKQIAIHNRRPAQPGARLRLRSI